MIDNYMTLWPVLARKTRPFACCISKIAPGIAYVALATLMLNWTWLGWADPIIDFGEELYVAWQVSTGQHIFKNIDYIYGALSPYWNGLWFAIFGPSAHLLFGINFLIACAVFGLLHRILSTIARPTAVFTAMVSFILLFFCSQYTDIGNENFLAPYRHGITHGLLLSLAALWIALKWQESQRLFHAGMTGLFLGLACLTKPEAAIPGLAATLAIFIADAWTRRTFARRDLAAAGIALAGMAIPIFGLFAYLNIFMPWRTATTGLCAPWMAILDPANRQGPYYQSVLGTNNTLGNLILMLKASFLYILVLSVPIAVGKWLSNMNAFLISAGLGIILIWLSFRHPFPWHGFARPFPLMLLVGLVLSLCRIARGEPSASSRLAIHRMAFEVFALLLLLKMILHANIYHYGFVLALPATLYAVVLLLDWLPAALRNNDNGFRLLALVLLGLVMAGHFFYMYPQLKAKKYTAGSGSDQLRTHVQGPFLDQLLSHARYHIPRHTTLAVFPEGASINYWMKLRNSTPYTCLLPFDLARLGEEHILAAYREAPPDYLILVNRDTSDWGPRFFGQDYAHHIRIWIQDHYEKLQLVGRTYPFQGDEFSLLLLKRRL